MLVILGLLFIVGMVAAVSLGMAYLLDVNAPAMPVKKRAAFAAVCGGILPMLLPLIGVLTAAPSDVPTWVPLVALLAMAITFALLVGFPSAFLFSKKREERRGSPISPETFE